MANATSRIIATRSPDADRRPPGRRRPQVQPLPHHCALLADAGGAPVGPQPSHGRDGRDHGARDLGTGLGGWDLLLRKLAHAAEYAFLGLLLARAAGRPSVALLLGVTYAALDEVHQTFVPGRAGRPLDVLIDTAGLALGVFAWERLAARRTA